MSASMLDILRTIATAGTPPAEGCTRIDFGSNRPIVERIIGLHVERDMPDGRSTQKLIVGSYGSGKTHLLRQVLEQARGRDCVTAEAAVTPATDLANPMFLYRQVAQNIWAPGATTTGIEPMLRIAVGKLRAEFGGGLESRAPAEAWIADVPNAVRSERSLARQIRAALKALLDNDTDRAQMPIRWLEGDVDSAAVAKATQETKLDKARQRQFGGPGLLALAEFARHAGWKGLVVGFDEAEQGFSTAPKKRDAILSVMRSDFDAVLRAQGAPLLAMIAITPDVRDEMANYPALQQRFRPPDGVSFFDGETEAHTRAPIIDLDSRYEPSRDLPALARCLVEAFYTEHADAVTTPKSDAMRHALFAAEKVQDREAAVQAQRELAKEVAAQLIRYVDPSFAPPPPPPEPEA